MTYQVLARKYRPQAFAEVIGQEHVTQTLANAIASGRLHHAYLFAGARGIGKTTVARILAKALNCEAREGSEPCNRCPSCNQITGGASLDVQEIDGASNTSVDDVREIRERVKYMPSHGRYTIYIIDEVHMLSTSAFNALLKTLEEPPPHVVFIFATTEAHKIPATILSRCQRYDFRRIPPQLIAATLKRIAREETVSIDDDAVRLIANEATGSLRDAESLFDQAIACGGEAVTVSTIETMLGILDRGLLFDLVGALLASDAQRALGTLDEVFRRGVDLARFAMDLLEMLRHLLVLAETNDARAMGDLLPHEVEQLQALAKKVPAPMLHQMFTSWYGVAERVARSPFPKMLLEVGLIRLCRVGSFASVDELIAKLEGALGTEGVSQPSASTLAASSRPAVPPTKQASPAPTPPAQKSEAKPTFEAVANPAFAVNEKRWQEFMRWLAAKRPQLSSIVAAGHFQGMEGDVATVAFDNRLYGDMIEEEERSRQVAQLLAEFFQRPVRLQVARADGADAAADRPKRRRQMEREALGSDMVQQAADILGAELHEVKVDGEK